MSGLIAIGGKKYVIATNSQTNTTDFEVTRPCNSLLMRVQSIANLWIRIHFEDSKLNRSLMVTDIKLTDYLTICQRLYPKCHVRQVDVPIPDPEDEGPTTEQQYQFLLPFSFDGDLDLSGDNKLIVQLYQKLAEGEELQSIDATFEYYCVGQRGYPISISRDFVRQSEDTSDRNFEGFDYAYFPEGVVFEYVQYPQEGYIGGARQTTYDQAYYDAAIYDAKNDIEFANGGVLFDTRTRSKLMLSHINSDDFTIYKVDCVSVPKLLNSAVKQGISDAQLKELVKSVGGSSLTGNIKVDQLSGNSLSGNSLSGNSNVKSASFSTVNGNNLAKSVKSKSAK